MKSLKSKCGFCRKEFRLTEHQYKVRTRQSKTGNLFCSQGCLTLFKRKASQRTVLCKKCKRKIVGPKWKVEGQRFCSSECFHSTRRAKSLKRICKYCKASFTVKKWKLPRARAYCSAACWRRFQVKSKRVRKCHWCGKKIFKKRASKLKHSFCGRRCFHNWNTDVAKKRNKRTCLECSEPFFIRGKRESERRFCTIKCALRHNGPTRPEQAVKNELRGLGISFSTSKNPLAQFTYPDFVIKGRKLCIYVDGEYWHKDNKARDLLQNRVLRAAGFTVVRIGERIAMDEKKLKKVLSKVFQQ